MWILARKSRDSVCDLVQQFLVDLAPPSERGLGTDSIVLGALVRFTPIIQNERNSWDVEDPL